MLARSEEEDTDSPEPFWLEPREEVVGLADRGFPGFECTSRPTDGYRSYPFAKAAEIVGRLTSIQGDCTTAEVQEMAEIYGARRHSP